jgi:hypothetical protein
VEGSDCGIIISGTIPVFEGTEENHQKLQSGYRSPDRDLKPGPPEYEAGVLTTRP